LKGLINKNEERKSFHGTEFTVLHNQESRKERTRKREKKRVNEKELQKLKAEPGIV
jgi:hypothetical protein